MATPTIDLTTIGAGGGCIAWIDKGGLLRVGPQSAGADPGPVCYDTGGEEVTVTDANLVLGRLNPDYFLGGTIVLNVAEGRRGGRRSWASGWGSTDTPPRRRCVDIANENMANAIRVLSIDRGLDPREYALVAFGGAGPLHACDIAAKMGMMQVIVPVYPGLTSAFGALIAEPKINQVWSKHFRSDAIDAATVGEHFEDHGRHACTRPSCAREGYRGRAGDRALDQHALLGPELRAGRADAGRRRDAGPAGADAGRVPPLARAVLRLLDQRRGDRVDPLQRRRSTSDAVPPSLPALPKNDRAGVRQTTRPVFFQGHGLIDCPIFSAERPAGRLSRPTGP